MRGVGGAKLELPGQLPLLVGVAAGYVLAVVTHAAWAGSGNASATGGAAMRRPVGELRSTSTYKISTLRLPPASISAASPHRERLLIVSTMTYEHMYRRPNLARTALQLRAAGYDDLVWIIIEDTHNLRKMTSSPAQYSAVLDATE
eukprot:gene3775-9664_t